MTFDAHVPLTLKKLQQWFAKAMTHPVGQEGHFAATPLQKIIALESPKYLGSTSALGAYQRIELYSRQYWWRLQKHLQQIFPALVSLLGKVKFNQTIAMPYLMQHPSQHWSLNYLGDRMPEWIRQHAPIENSELYSEIAKVELEFNNSLFASAFKPILPETLKQGDSVLVSKMYLQPYVCLIQMNQDLLAFREEVLKQPSEYWVENPMPKIAADSPYYFVIFRNSHHNASWDKISEASFLILNFLRRGATLEEMCEWLELQDESVKHEAESLLQEWFHEWAMRHWLTFQTSSL